MPQARRLSSRPSSLTEGTSAATAASRKIEFKTLKLHYQEMTWILKFPRIPRAEKSTTLYLNMIKDLFLQKAFQENILPEGCTVEVSTKRTGERDIVCPLPLDVFYKDQEASLIHVNDEEDLKLAYEDWNNSLPMNFYFVFLNK